MQKIIGFCVAFILLGFSSSGYCLNQNDPCTNPAGESGRCIPLRECDPLVKIFEKTFISPQESSFVDQSRCGLTDDRRPLVCCKSKVPVATLPKPPLCGRDFSDRIHGGQATDLDEFPWTAMIEYSRPNGQTGFHCGGSLINSRYVLTAAHCIQAIPPNWNVVGIRLGEWDLDKKLDCMNDTCADAPVDMGIEKIIVHEDYNPQNQAQHNDIALIRLSRDVQNSAYIDQVCLPIEDPYRTRNNIGSMGYAAGWGQTENGTASNVKLKVQLEIKDLQSCANLYRKARVVLRDTQMCAGGVKGEDTCSGDSGGPLMKLERANYFLYGIVSFGPHKCGTQNVPGVYTNVAKYIDWIESNLE